MQLSNSQETVCAY